MLGVLAWVDDLCEDAACPMLWRQEGCLPGYCPHGFNAPDRIVICGIDRQDRARFLGALPKQRIGDEAP